MQQLLDTALDQAPTSARQRFDSRRRVAENDTDPTAGLHVAIAIVQRDGEILLVRRRDSEALNWQFPAGVVKPGSSSQTAAVRETLAETGVDCAVRTTIGARQHPITDVYCVYYLCDYLAGDAENRDVVENMSVRWAPTAELTRFVPRDQLFPPILDALEATT